MAFTSTLPDGSMRYVSLSGGNSFSVGLDGRVTSVADSLKSMCGADFDEYVRRALSAPFPYSPTNPAFRKVTDLWSGRRLRIFTGTDWREGKVRHWTQSTSGPFSPITMWSLEVEFDTCVVGDAVTIDGLKVANKYNGKKGIIREYIEEQGRYKVQTIESVVGVKLENLKTPFLKFDVNRINIEGGGTVVPTTGTRSLLSLEWLEPASPSINLDEGSLTATCPKCRAAEPPLATYSEAPTETEHECPICLETKQCHLLKCKHVVCSDCWTSWRSVACGRPVRPPMIDSEQLQKERADRLREALEISPHELGGFATKPGESGESKSKALEKWEMVHRDKVLSLVELANNGEQGLAQFWEELLVFPMPFFSLDSTFDCFVHELDIPALEILLQVSEQRKDECCAYLKKLSIARYEHFFDERCFSYCQRIGEMYEEVKNYRGSIPWYERSLAHGMKLPIVGFETILPTLYSNLGLAQKRAGLLSAALENYNASLQLQPVGDALNNRIKLLREMKEWTGSSGILTPGC